MVGTVSKGETTMPRIRISVRTETSKKLEKVLYQAENRPKEICEQPSGLWLYLPYLMESQRWGHPNDGVKPALDSYPILSATLSTRFLRFRSVSICFFVLSMTLLIELYFST